MNTEHRYIFEKGSKKHRCPNPKCGKKRFVRYIDKETGEYLPDQYGRCDRESKCGYLLNPYKDGYAKAIWEQEQGNKTDWKPQQPKRIKKPVNKPQRAFIPVEVLSRTRAGYEQNIFIQNLLSRVAFPFEVQDIEKVISLYHLGTVFKTGAVCFPFIDIKNNVNAVQEKIFNHLNHTDKTKKYHTGWLHSRLTYSEYKNKPLPEWLEAYNKNEIKVSCLFGEHNLNKYPKANVFLFEAPKTAIYGTLYFGFPEQSNILCLAVYNLSSLNLDKCKVLKGRNVYLFPDLSKDGKAYDKWKADSEQIQKRLQGTYFHVSDLLEQLAPQQDKEQGKDIADYLIKQDWQLFRKQDIKETPQPEPLPVETPTREKSEALKKTFFSQLREIGNLKKKQLEPKLKESNYLKESNPQNWSNDIVELETYFASVELPTQPVTLNSSCVITNCSLFIESHFTTVKANNGKLKFLPYLDRLQELKQVLKINLN